MVAHTIRKMTHGHLLLSWPDGTREEVGQPGQLPAAQWHFRRLAGCSRLLLGGHIGLAEGYMAGHWHTPDLEAMLQWGLANHQKCGFLDEARQPWFTLVGSLQNLRWRLWHWVRSTWPGWAFRNIRAHYDLGNRFFQTFLDPTMTYSSALFSFDEQTLEDAQLAKYERLGRALGLAPGMRVLEIGCGWGSFAAYAARRFGCHIHAITLSWEQYAYVRRRIRQEGLTGQVTVDLEDYRYLASVHFASYDRIVSIEMIEAIGERQYETFFSACRRFLKPHGQVGLQMIVCPDSRFHLLRRHVDFIQAYVFPGSLIPSLGRLKKAMAPAGLDYLNLFDMGQSYARTLRVWEQSFMARQEDVMGLGFDMAFVRKWQYYLLYCAAAFHTQHLSVVQAVLGPPALGDGVLMDVDRQATPATAPK